MSKMLFIGLAAASSLIAGAAMAQDEPAPAQTTVTVTEETTTTTTSVPAAKLAPTPSANVASSTTSRDVDGAIVTRELVTSGPVPDTAENRARYGQPMSHAGKKTAPRGN
ncbi:MAG: hypothetical protein ABIQ08_09700 [Duganella sp.]